MSLEELIDNNFYEQNKEEIERVRNDWIDKKNENKRMRAQLLQMQKVSLENEKEIECILRFIQDIVDGVK